MSNRNIFMDMGADTEVELHLKSNAMSFSKLFGDGDKIKSEYLPENAGGGSVDLGPLEARVAALENAPKGEGGGNPLGVYDKSVYTKVVNESELLSQLTSEQRGNYERLNRLCRAAFCWKNLSGIETGQDTAEKIVLEDGTVFQRLTDGKLNRNVGGLFDVYLSSFFNLSTLQKVDFLRLSLPGLNKVLVVQVESDTEDLSAIVSGQFVGRFFRLEETEYTAEKGPTEDVVAIASDAKNLITDTRTLATNAKSTADEAKTKADEAKVVADRAKAKADEAKVVADQAYENSTKFTELSVDVRAFKSEMNDVKGYIPELTRISTVAQSAADRANHRLDDFQHVTGFIVEGRFEIEDGKDPSLEEDGQVHENGLGNYLPRLFFNTVYGDVCVRVGSGVFKLLNKGLCFRFYRDESDSGLWHERQYYTFMDREVEVKVLDYRVDEDYRWKMVGEHLNTKSPQEQIKELFGLS